MEISITGAFIVGLMGAAHCFGMCGGLIGAFSAGLPATKGNHLASQLQFLLIYNAGRVFSYTVAGAMLGGGAAALSQLFALDNYLLYLRFFAGALMILTGLYIANLWMVIAHIEKLGKGIWSLLQPLTKKVLPIRQKRQALIAGMLWGWLPCGLVYSTLTWSVASGSMLTGGFIMLAFGLGTLPALLSAGLAAQKLSQFVKHKAVRLISGLFIISFGLQTIYIAFKQLN